ncbi:MAG TPA: arginine--tRNA ligase, partial [Patescibacteria group bacterium]|nr:arginine--tRNA ligase [Patescibacteria group bacterium]
MTTKEAAARTTLRARARDAVGRGLDRAIQTGALPDSPEARSVAAEVSRPANPEHGDLATNLALRLARPLRMAPPAIAAALAAAIDVEAAGSGAIVASAEAAGPGFVNLRFSDSALEATIDAIRADPASWGRVAADAAASAGRRVNVEFVSANPTGPLHVGHGRGAALGDAIAALLEWTGHRVTREFYINDAGVQIDRLALSLWARVRELAGHPAAIPEGGYHGDYLKEIAREVLDLEGRGFADLPEDEGVRRSRALALRMQRVEQDRDLADFGVRFDVMSSEQLIYDSGRVDRALRLLHERALTFEADGALWLRTTA